MVTHSQQKGAPTSRGAEHWLQALADGAGGATILVPLFKKKKNHTINTYNTYNHINKCCFYAVYINILAFVVFFNVNKQTHSQGLSCFFFF